MDTNLKSRDWSGLSDLLLDSIFQKLSSISDCLRFGVVCKSWFSFVSNNYDTLQQRINSSSIDELPLLMIFTNRGSSTIYTSLYNVTKGKIMLDLELPLPDYTRESCGSSNGWLAFQTCDCSNIILFNPFSGESIHLPSPNFQVDKFCLSKNPSTNSFNFEVAAVSMGYSNFAILKPGSKTWSYTHLFPNHCDLVYYNERCYIVNNIGRVLSMDSTTLEFKEIAPPLINCYTLLKRSKFYLVKTTTNKLLRVQISHPYYDKSSIKISKLVASPTTQNLIFEELDNLGDEALFLCDNHSSMSVSASKFLGCKPNSIYHMHYFGSRYYKSLYYCLDIIHLQDGSFQTHYSSFNTSIANNMPPALWIIPTPKFTTTSLRHGFHI